MTGEEMGDIRVKLKGAKGTDEVLQRVGGNTDELLVVGVGE